MNKEKEQVEKIREAFNEEFGRFADFRAEINGLSLTDAENLQRELQELKTKHTGKKSEIAGAKKLIGRVTPEDRGEFGQFVQVVEKEIITAIEEVESNLQVLSAKPKPNAKNWM